VREIGCVVSLRSDTAVVGMPMSGACKNCGICMIADNGKEVLVLAKNSAGAAEGDTVEIEVRAGKVVAAAFIVYMIPVFMTIIGFVVGNWMAGGAEDANLPIILAVVFLVASFVGVWLYDRRLRKTEEFTAVVTRVLSDEEAEEHHRRVTPVSFGG